jgi:PhnB protein
MRFTTHLMFEGECEEAFRFYERLFGGRLQTLLRYGESPMATEVEAGLHDKILHATLHAGEGVITGGDLPPGQYQPPQGFFVLFEHRDLQRAEEIFDALADGGMVTLPFGRTFWSAGFGVVTDRFGVPWEVNCVAPLGRSAPR